MFIMSLVGDNPGVEVDRRTVNLTPKSSLRIGVGSEGVSVDGSNKKEERCDDPSLKEVLYSIKLE